MNTHKLVLPGVVSLCALTTLAFSSAPALAERGRVFGGSFGEGQLSLLAAATESPGSSLAVNEATHDVYVADTANHRVVEFSAGGAFIRAWGWGVTNGANEAQVCTTACRPGIPGSAPGQFDTPTSIAVDNATGGKDDVYVSDYAQFRSEDNIVQKFTPEGVLIASWAGGGQLREGTSTNGETFYGIGGVGVSSAGDLWVGTQEGLFEFERSGALIQRVPSGFVLSFPTIVGLSFDSADDVFLDAVYEAHKFDASGGNLGTSFQSSTPSTGLAVDRASGELFYDEGSSIAAIASSCAPRLVAPYCAASGHFGPPQLGVGAGMAVDSQLDAVYVADVGNGRIDSYVPEPAGAPTVEDESLVEVSATSATFTAAIDPHSEDGERDSEYEFQYGPCASPEGCSASGYERSAPLPAGLIAASFQAEAVSAHVSDLTADGAYHFRVIARNSHGQSVGEEHVFTTQGPGGEVVLPDGRAWELVSPPDKQGSRLLSIEQFGVVEAAGDGHALTYRANAPTERQPQGYGDAEVQILSRREAGAWSTRDIAIPHAAATGKSIGAGDEYKAFSDDLASALVQPFGPFEASLSSEASESTPFIHGLESSCAAGGCYRPLVSGVPGAANVPAGTQFGEDTLCEKQPGGRAAKAFCGPEFLGASNDLAHVVVRAKAELVTGAGSGQLYEWSNGALSLVSVLPGGEPAVGPQLGQNDRAARHAVSADGKRVFWQDAEHLYVRDTALGETVALDLPQTGCGTCTGGGGGSFQGASADGSRVFFKDSQRLTADSGAVPGSDYYDLYECELTVSSGKLACMLTDVTPKRGEESGALRGGILGMSEDGEWVYFAANGVLSANANNRGEHAEAGACGGESSSISGVSCNLYVRHGGSTSFIARLSGLDGTVWAQALLAQPTRVSPDGEWLEFMSAGEPTGYDNRDVHIWLPVVEVYLYDAKDGRVICASCLPSGARPTGVVYASLDPVSGGLAGGPRGLWSAEGLVAANVPGWTAFASGNQDKELYQSRYLGDSGRLFFDSADALVPGDVNSTEDVYEYEPVGVGGCQSGLSTYDSAAAGCVGLISSGGSAQESAFLDASESGDDVFFLTAAKLTTRDVDASFDVYDAHVCSGASPCVDAVDVQSPPCTNESSCKASPSSQPSIFGPPASATFSGAGNLPPAVSKPKVKARIKPLTRSQRLAEALRACRRDRKSVVRARCERRARGRYGARGKKSSVRRSIGRGL